MGRQRLAVKKAAPVRRLSLMGRRCLCATSLRCLGAMPIAAETPTASTGQRLSMVCESHRAGTYGAPGA